VSRQAKSRKRAFHSPTNAPRLRLLRDSLRPNFWTLLVAAISATVAPVAFTKHLPMQDLPVLASMARALAQGGESQWCSRLEMSLGLRPYAAFFVPASALARVVDAIDAVRLLTAMYVVALPLAVAIWLQALGKRRPWTAILVVPLTYSDIYTLGLLNYLWSMVLAFLAAAAAIRIAKDDARMRAAIAFSVIAILMLLLHPFGVALTALLIIPGLPAFIRRPRRLLWIAGAALPLAFLVLYFKDTLQPALGPSHSLPMQIKLHYLLMTPWILLEGGTPALAIAAMICAAFVVFVLIVDLRHRGILTLVRQSSSLSCLAAVLVAVGLYAVLPFVSGDTVWIDLRIAPVVWILLIALIDTEGRNQRSALIASSVLVAITVAGVSLVHSRFDREIAPLDTTIEAIEPDSRVLAIALDLTSDAYTPFYSRSGAIQYFSLYVGFGNYYHALKGGFSPFMTFGYAWSPLRLNPLPQSLTFGSADVFQPAALLRRLPELSNEFDYLLLRTRDRLGFPWVGSQASLVSEAGEFSAWRLDHGHRQLR